MTDLYGIVTCRLVKFFTKTPILWKERGEGSTCLIQGTTISPAGNGWFISVSVKILDLFCKEYLVRPFTSLQEYAGMTTCFVQTTVESDGDAFKQLNAVFQVSEFKLWNSLPNELQAVHNLYTFKQSFKHYILNNEINEQV